MKDKHQLRISGPMDPVTVLDNSAKVMDDPTWLNHPSEGGGHYYGNIADLYAGFDGPDGDGYLGNTAPSPPPPPSRGITWDIQKFLTQPWNDATPVTTDPSPQCFFCSFYNAIHNRTNRSRSISCSHQQIRYYQPWSMATSLRARTPPTTTPTGGHTRGC